MSITWLQTLLCLIAAVLAVLAMDEQRTSWRVWYFGGAVLFAGLAWMTTL